MISQKNKKIHIIGTNAKDIDDCTLEAMEKIDCSDLIIIPKVFENAFFIHAKNNKIKIIEQESLSKQNNRFLWKKIFNLFDSQNKVISHLLDGDTYIDNKGLVEKKYFDNCGIECEVIPGIIKFVNIINKNSELLTDREKNSSVTFIKIYGLKEVEKILKNSFFEKVAVFIESKEQFIIIKKYLKNYQSIKNFKIKYIDANSEKINKLSINNQNMLINPSYIIIEKK